MDRVLRIKLLVLLLIAAVSLWNYELVFYPDTGTLYHYSVTLVMITALCFGVILSTAIYNFAIYFYLKSRQHLFYALAQFFVLFSLIALDSLYIAPFDEIFGFKSLFVLDMTQDLMLFFSLLFIKEFVVPYTGERLDGLINAVLYLILFDILFTLFFSHTLVTKLVPVFVFIWLVLSEANRLAEKKDLPFYYLLFGWGLVLLIVALEYIGVRDRVGVVFPFLHVALALDSLILSLAISYKIKLLDEERVAQHSMLLQQSRLASMGEMIAIIAHQWRQPLTFLSFALMQIRKKCTAVEAQKTIKEASSQLQYMSQTIEQFRNFYNPAKTKSLFDIQKACENVVQMLSSAVPWVTIEVRENFSWEGNQNEFEQVIMNLLNNAKDAIEANGINVPRITIEIDRPCITVSDNGGGIDPKTQKKIFEPYFSTKKGNDGIGLYIARMVIEKEMGGKLSLQKSDANGTSFRIKLGRIVS
jgi:signal transduction histidine kinase